MRKILNILTVSLILSIAIFLTDSLYAQTQAPPPPQTHGVGGDVPGGGAPVGEGIVFLVAMGAAYGARKVYSMRRKLAE
jgi:hypothetical protein